MPQSTICVDSNFVLRLVQSGSYQDHAVQLWRGWHQAGRSLVAPALLYYEVSDALRRYVVRRELLPEEAAQVLEAVLGLGIVLVEDADLHRHALVLAGRLGLSGTYSAHYLALAERLEGELWTADQRLVQEVGESLRWVHLVSQP